MTALQAVRTIVFYVLFMAQTIILAIIVGTIAIIFRRRTAVSWALAMYWRNSNVWMLRCIVGIRTQIEGIEHVPASACIIGAKHQSDWDIFAILPATFDEPAFIAKRELIDIPFFGWAAQSINTISIDRKLGAEAIPRMMDDARAALARGCHIIIFPEGTRKKPLDPPDYRQGLTRMYEGLDVPVVPAATDSGLYWGREGWIMWPGTARVRFLQPIPPGLSGAEFSARLQQVVEAESTAMILEAVDGGIARPITPAFRERIAAAQANGPRSL